MLLSVDIRLSAIALLAGCLAIEDNHRITIEAPELREHVNAAQFACEDALQDIRRASVAAGETFTDSMGFVEIDAQIGCTP